LGASEEAVVFQRLGLLSRGKVLFTLRQAGQDFAA